MINKFFGLFLFMLVLIPSVYAEAPQDLSYTFKTGTNVTIIRPCVNTLSPTGSCSTNLSCQISVTDQDNNIVVFGQTMTNTFSTYNTYENATINISQNGIYKADIVCLDTGEPGFDSFYFGVNEAGTDYRTNSGIMFLLGITILLMIIFGLFAYFLEKTLRIVFMLLSAMMLPVSVWITSQIVANSFFAQNLVNVINGGYTLSLIFFGTFVLYVLVSLTSKLTLRNNTKDGAVTTESLSRKDRNKKEKEGRDYEDYGELEE